VRAQRLKVFRAKPRSQPRGSATPHLCAISWPLGLLATWRALISPPLGEGPGVRTAPLSPLPWGRGRGWGLDGARPGQGIGRLTPIPNPFPQGEGSIRLNSPLQREGDYPQGGGGAGAADPKLRRLAARWQGFTQRPQREGGRRGVGVPSCVRSALKGFRAKPPSRPRGSAAPHPCAASWPLGALARTNSSLPMGRGRGWGRKSVS
jgi:hypothetical protein